MRFDLVMMLKKDQNDMYSYAVIFCIFFYKQKTACEMRMSDWSSDVCSSDLVEHGRGGSPETGLLVRGMAKANADAQGDFAALLTGGRLGLLIEPEHGGQNYQAVVAVEEIGRASCRERVCQYV